MATKYLIGCCYGNCEWPKGKVGGMTAFIPKSCLTYVVMQVHGRSREQRYTKLADWDYIAECAEVASPMPLFGCGDVLSYEDHVQHTQRDLGIMIAR